MAKNINKIYKTEINDVDKIYFPNLYSTSTSKMKSSKDFK